MSIQPPTATDQLPPPPSSTTGNNLTTSPMTPTTHTISNTNAVQTSTPESRLAATLSGIIFNIPSTSFQDAVATTNHCPLLPDASVNQGPSTITTATTPPKIPQNKPPRRDAMTTDDQQPRRTRKKTPLRRPISETTDQQPQKKTKTKTPPPQASPTPTGKGSSESERSRKMEDAVREIEQRCREMLDEEEEDVEIDDTHQPQSQVQEECVGVERDKNGDLKFDLSCSCGERFEILIKPNGYCFYKFT